MIEIDIPEVLQLNLESSQVVTKEGIVTCTFKLDFVDDRSSYMWSSIHSHYNNIHSEAIQSLACRVCHQPVLKQPCKIERCVSVSLFQPQSEFNH